MTFLLCVFRVYMSALSIATWVVAITDPASLFGRMAGIAGGQLLTWLALALGVAGLLDIAINDWMPARFSWRSAQRHRHFLLAAMAFCYVAQLFLASLTIAAPGLLLYYLFCALGLVFASYIDAYCRKKDAQCQFANN